MDTDNSGGLDSQEFCIAMKKLVSSETGLRKTKADDARKHLSFKV
jgi:hypothetical protein